MNAHDLFPDDPIGFINCKLGSIRSSSLEKIDYEGFNEERKTLESLVDSRFNYLMLLFGAILVYSFSRDPGGDRIIILTFGLVPAFFIAASIYRVQVKLDIVQRILHRFPDHPVRITSDILRAEQGKFGSHPMTWVVGRSIPFGCCVALVLLDALSIIEKVSIRGINSPGKALLFIVAFLLLVCWAANHYRMSNRRWPTK